ncbi:MAG: hypothetical protein Q8P81_02655 [Nanoarchaeota archaeon]|nr:hypothetical protein [Nanoarchaeota archaeon]
MKFSSKFFKRALNGINYRVFTYGVFSNWGMVILSNVLGILFINIIGIDMVRVLHPFAYMVLSIALYFVSPNFRDFRLGWLVGFLLGLIFLFKFYYSLFFGV